MSKRRHDRAPNEFTPGYYRATAGTCQPTGKAIYLTRKAAKQANKRRGDDCRPYLCDHCDRYHLGHQLGKARQWHRDFHEGRDT